MGGRVLITGAASPLGAAVVQVVAADPDVEHVDAVDRPGAAPAPTSAGAPGGGVRVAWHALDLTDPELARLLDGVTTVVHLGRALGSTLELVDGIGTEPDVAGTRRLLAAAADAGVSHLVVLSSAMVYGAWSNNPVPLTEEAPLRPVPDLDLAVERAEVERSAAAWRDDGEGRTVAVLRPALVVHADPGEWLRRSPWAAGAPQLDEVEPPRQFLHLEDLVSALDLVRREHLDGAFNVAPDGWLPAEAVRALAGPAPRVKLPAAFAHRVATMRFRAGLTRIPPSVLAHRLYPWVVANDRLRAAGWVPTHTNEEAYVEADRGGPLSSMSAAKRQALSLGGVVVGVGVLVAAAVIVLRRRRRRG